MTEEVAFPPPSALFDANAYLGPLAQRAPGPAEDAPGLVALLDRYGIARALVTHTLAKWHDPATGNARLMRELAGQERLTGCWVVLPSGTREVPPEEEQVAQLLRSGARVARLCPAAFRLTLEPFEVDTHWSEPRPWLYLEWPCRAYPALPVVLLRESQSQFRTLFRLLDRCPNLVIETSYLQGHDAIHLLVERWGAAGLGFGTGLPVWDPGRRQAGLTYAGLAPADLEAVAHGTLDRLLGGCSL